MGLLVLKQEAAEQFVLTKAKGVPVAAFRWMPTELNVDWLPVAVALDKEGVK